MWQVVQINVLNSSPLVTPNLYLHLHQRLVPLLKKIDDLDNVMS